MSRGIRQTTDVALGRDGDGEIDDASVRARFAWARRQGHASYLWPDVPVGAWRACLHEIERVAMRVLAGECTDIEPPAGTDARAFGIAAFTSGMGPLLGYWIETMRVHAPSAIVGILASHLRHGRARTARMAAELTRVLDLLAAAGHDAVVIKSSHTGPAYFSDPGTRPAADIDLVIDAAAMQAAVRALDRAGYTLLKVQRRPLKSDWLPPGVGATLRSLDLSHERNPFTIELHDSVDRVFFGVRDLRLGPLDARNTRPAPELHPAARVLMQPWLAVYLAAHASEELHQLQLIRLVELVHVMRTDVATDALDPYELLAFLRHARIARFTVPAFTLAERLSPGSIHPLLLAELERAATPRMRRVLRDLGPGTAQRLEGLSLDERFLWAHGPVETARRVLHLVWPNRGESRSLASIYADRFARIINGRISLRRRR